LAFWSGGMVLLGLLVCGVLWLALGSVELLDDELDVCATATAVASSSIAVNRVIFRMDSSDWCSCPSAWAMEWKVTRT